MTALATTHPAGPLVVDAGADWSQQAVVENTGQSPDKFRRFVLKAGEIGLARSAWVPDTGERQTLGGGPVVSRGVWKTMTDWMVSHQWAEIADAVSLDGLDRKWNVDGAALVKKIKTSGILGQTALIDASEQWWRRVANGEQLAFGDLLPAQERGLRYPHNVPDED